MNRKLILSLATVFGTSLIFAQSDVDSTENEKKSKLRLSGSADVYYKYDFAKTRQNSLTSFTQSHNQFSLGMASLKVEFTTGKVGMIADLGFGSRAREFSYTDIGITQAIKQLYVSYAPTESLKFTMGTWATHIGYEVLDPQFNRNYSMSYMFTNGPFSHTGLKAEYARDGHGLMLGISNPSDYRIIPDGLLNKKFMLAQYSFAASDAFKLYLNYAGGQHPDSSKSNQFDMVATGKLGENFSVGFNGTYAQVRLWDNSTHKNQVAKPWWGSALYLNYDPVAWFGLSLRSELFNDHNHLKSLGFAAVGDHIFSNTLSANFKMAGLTIIPEVRFDHVNKKGLFTDIHHNSTSNDLNILFGAIYSF